VVKVLVRHVFFNHTHDALPVGVQFGFCEDDDVILIGSDMVIEDFPGGTYTPAVDSGDVSVLSYSGQLVGWVGSGVFCFVTFVIRFDFGGSGRSRFFCGWTCSEYPFLFEFVAVRDSGSAGGGTVVLVRLSVDIVDTFVRFGFTWLGFAFRGEGGVVSSVLLIGGEGEVNLFWVEMELWLEGVSPVGGGGVSKSVDVSLKVVPVSGLEALGSFGIFRIHVPPLTIVLLNIFGMSISSTCFIVEDEVFAVGGESLDNLLLSTSREDTCTVGFCGVGFDVLGGVSLRIMMVSEST
jgi:hypothetical protein